MSEVSIVLSNGNLGRQAESQDGVSALIVTGVAVGGQFALGDILSFKSLADAEAKGITSAYDNTNTCMAWRHIKDFYDEAEKLGVKGIQLYVIVVAKTVTMTQMCDKTLTHAAKLLNDVGVVNGAVRLMGVTRIPDGAYTPTFDSEFEADLWTAVTKAQELGVDQFDKFRPMRFFIEGRNFQGSASSAKDLKNASTGTNANRVYVVAGADNSISTLAAHANKYAAVGKALGRAAAIQVMQSIGRVKSGAVNVTKAGLSNNATIDAFGDANLKTLSDKGYIVFRTYAGLAGYYFYDEPAACPATDDYSTIALGRVIDKACRITRSVYVTELQENVLLDPVSGKLTMGTVKAFQQKVENEINLQMTSKFEVSGCSAFVDPNQNVLTLGEIKIQLNLVPVGTAKNIIVTLGYKKSLA